MRMTDMLRLHYAPDNASLCVRLALEEAGLDYEAVLVDRRRKIHKSPDFLAMNPNGLIPVLETPDGPMFETGAILLWLTDRSAGLLPTPAEPGRAHALQWLIWLSNTLHPAARMLFYPDQYSDGDPEASRVVTRRRITAQLDLLERVRNADWLDTDAASAQGCYLAPLLRWFALYGGSTAWFDLRRWPRLHGFAGRMEQRDSACRAAIAEGLGLTPFSAPQPCQPPEGSAI